MSRKSIFLVGSMKNQLICTKLPSRGDVLSLLFYNMHEVNLNLHDSASLVIDETEIFWKKARIPTQDRSDCIKKCKKLYEIWRSLYKHKTRQSDLCRQKEQEFEDSLNNIFDIAHANALKKTVQITEDKECLLSQRKKGRPVCLLGIDKKLFSAEVKEAARQEKEMERKQMECAVPDEMGPGCTIYIKSEPLDVQYNNDTDVDPASTIYIKSEPVVVQCDDNVTDCEQREDLKEESGFITENGPSTSSYHEERRVHVKEEQELLIGNVQPTLESDIDKVKIGCYHCKRVASSLGKLRKHIHYQHIEVIYPQLNEHTNSHNYFSLGYHEMSMENSFQSSDIHPQNHSQPLNAEERTSQGNTLNGNQFKNSDTSKKIFDYSAFTYDHLSRSSAGVRVPHTEGKTYQCTLCGYCCNQASILRTHVLTHSDEKPFMCTICSYRCRFSWNLKSHMLTHTVDKPFQCSMCKLSFRHASNLKSHMLTHSDEKPHQCTICGFRCRQSGTLKRHILTHQEDKPFQCTMCSFKCLQSGSLKRHMAVHSEKKPFECPICAYTCRQSAGLKSHMMIHSKKKPFQCEICIFRCRDSGTLKNHMLTHTEAKPFQCTICGFRCEQSVGMKTHMSKHKETKPYQCTICNYRCRQSSCLKRHLLTHEKSKSVQCTICSYKCRQLESLKTHMLKHLNEKHFQCTLCQYTCRQVNSMKKHMLKHTGEKPFPCSRCDYRSPDSENLKRHISEKHWDSI